MSEKFYAHSKEGCPPEKWQPLEEHLENVARLAADFAEPFGGEEWMQKLGVIHDIGKGTLPWQAFLRKANSVVDEFSPFLDGHPTHAFLGAQHIFNCSPQAGKLAAYCIAGHHVGLPNWEDHGASALKLRLAQEYAKCEMPLPLMTLPTTLPFKVNDTERFGFQLQFYVRMLFSCLVDADYLDTELFIDSKKSCYRSVYPSLEQLYKRFWRNFDKLRKHADSETIVNQSREAVLKDCLEKAVEPHSIFSLTVPTGGGKTLASLAFALKHAQENGKRRIIYVIPFTSIIEQNAKVFRDILGNDAVLEHHCNFVTDDSDWKTRLASENWDAPIVVTTNVQFFDSFYANKTSKSRKLHNVANSIVIFDEVQAIPVEKLKPCLEVIKELSLNYGVTSVLCTATQPAFDYSDTFKSGLKNVREIVADVPTLFSTLKRTEDIYLGELDETEIASLLSEHEQVLCIVNTRQQALDIFSALPESEANIHLSALMYPSHRSTVLKNIRQRLKDNLPCKVISTQLIEAGVDVDFPCVFRAVSGIDSIAQASGRCNRNGLSKTPCKVFLFQFPEENRCAFFKQSSQSAQKLLDQFAGILTTPECVKAYFEDYFWKNEQRMDLDGIIEICKKAQNGNIQFRDIAEFKMIKSASIPIVIAFDKKAVQLVNSLKFIKYKRGVLRKLQQYTVQVYPYQFEALSNWLETPEIGIHVLFTKDLYSDKTGLQCIPPEGSAFFI